jgi:hypothetical protein
MPIRFVLRGFVLALLAAGVAAAQTIDFSLLASSNGSAVIVPNNSTLPFLATVGTQQQITVTATYEGTTQATITTLPQQVGSTEFSVKSSLTLPAVLTRGQSFTLVITYSPINANGAAGAISINYTEPTGTGGAAVQNVIQIGLSGASPNFTLGYVLQTSQNFVSIPNGGTIPFGATQINTMATADLDIGNTGSGEGVITAITQPPAGSPFKVTGIPQLPYGLQSGMTYPLVVTYSPTAVENDTASIQITFQGGVTETVNFSGNGITSTFTYKVLITGKAATTVTSGGTITFPGANVGGTSGNTSSLIVTVTNSGTASGTISSVSTTGPFTLTNPVTLPTTLTTGNSFSVSLTFTPTQVGTQTGQLQIGNAYFTLSGQGLGANLTYAYTSSAGTTTVTPPNGAVLFSSIQVGQSEKVTFTVTNSGSLPATISLIGINPSNGPFTVPAVSAQTLAASKSLSFPITFTPTVTGISNASLVVNLTSITLQGNATVPTALPSYTISGPSGITQPATQSNISLTLSKGYSLDLTGTLTITTEGTLGSDPAVQFETGSTAGNRTVDFTIAAGATSADFAGQGSQILVQTGTVAETVTLAPTFETTGGVSVTPSSLTTLQFTIPSDAPVLVSASISNQSTNGFDLVLTGYTTTRSLSSLSVTITPATGFNIQTSIPAISLSQASTTWFASSASEAFGGQFSVTETFTLQGTAKTGQTLLQSIASVTATVGNNVGTSSSLSASVE